MEARTGEHTPPACGFRRRAENIIAQTSSPGKFWEYCVAKVRARRPNWHAGRVRSPMLLRISGSKPSTGRRAPCLRLAISRNHVIETGSARALACCVPRPRGAQETVRRTNRLVTDLSLPPTGEGAGRNTRGCVCSPTPTASLLTRNRRGLAESSETRDGDRQAEPWKCPAPRIGITDAQTVPSREAERLTPLRTGNDLNGCSLPIPVCVRMQTVQLCINEP